MVDHIVLFRLQPEAKHSDVQSLIEALRRLAAEVPGVLSYRIQHDAHLREGNDDLGLVARFQDAEAFSNYLAHPRHLAILAELAPGIIADKHSVQLLADSTAEPAR